MGIKFSNNASANIIRDLSSTATSVSVTVGKGDLFPSLTEGDYFYATLAGNNGLEIVKVINRVDDTMTIVRAQDNTTALSFDTGDLFELRIVAADFNDTFSEVNDKLEASIEETTSIVNSALSSKAPILHASSSTEFGTGTSTQYGHNKLSDATNSDLDVDGGTAATPKAVKTAKAEAVTTVTEALTAFAETQAAKDAEQDSVIGTIREDTVAAAQDAAKASSGESGTVTLEGVAAEVANLSAVLGGLEDGSGFNAAGKSEIVGWGMPDYSALIFKTWDTLYTAECNGWVYVFAQIIADLTKSFTLEIDGVKIVHDDVDWNTTVSIGHMVPIHKGSTYKGYNGANHMTIVFFPCKEVA